MKNLTEIEFQRLCCNAKVLETDADYGDKVLWLEDDTVVKLFKLKKGIFSSSTLYPYARRFISNVSKLQKRDIPTLEVISEFKTQDPVRHCVHYSPLVGVTLRERYNNEQTPMSESQVLKLGKFIAELHNKGIYFRSVHLGNIVETPGGKLGLIDVADMKTYRSTLNSALRLRNFAHLIRCEVDTKNLNTQSPQGHWLLSSYLEASRNPLSQKDTLSLKKFLMIQS